MTIEANFCSNCGHSIPSASGFCPTCGSAQALSNPTPVPNSPIHTPLHPNVPYNENAHPGVINSTKLVFKDALKINKRMGRADYWWSSLGLCLFNVPFIFLFMQWLIGLSTRTDMTETQLGGSFITLLFLVFCWYLFLAIVNITAAIRRLHDAGLSGLYYFLTFVPFFGPLITIILYAQPSKQNGNRYM